MEMIIDPYESFQYSDKINGNSVVNINTFNIDKVSFVKLDKSAIGIRVAVKYNNGPLMFQILSTRENDMVQEYVTTDYGVSKFEKKDMIVAGTTEKYSMGIKLYNSEGYQQEHQEKLVAILDQIREKFVRFTMATPALYFQKASIDHSLACDKIGPLYVAPKKRIGGGLVTDTDSKLLTMYPGFRVYENKKLTAMKQINNSSKNVQEVLVGMVDAKFFSVDDYIVKNETKMVNGEMVTERKPEYAPVPPLVIDEDDGSFVSQLKDKKLILFNTVFEINSVFINNQTFSWQILLKQVHFKHADGCDNSMIKGVIVTCEKNEEEEANPEKKFKKSEQDK